MRWYEQNSELNELLNFIETIENDNKTTVAHHLLQILINECDINLDNEINKLSKNNYSYNRWYDDVADLSTSLELLKQLPSGKQEYVVKRLLSEIIMSYTKKELD